MSRKYFSLRTFPRLVRFVAVFAFAAGVFWLDLSMPLGTAVPVLYAVPVSWIALWSGRRETLSVIVTGLFATVLIVLRYLMASDGSEFEATNRILTIGVIWANIVLSIFRKVQEEDWELRRTMSDVLQQFSRGKVKQG